MESPPFFYDISEFWYDYDLGPVEEMAVTAQQAIQQEDLLAVIARPGPGSAANAAGQLPIQAAIADYLCAAAAALNETETLRAGRWEVFLVKPTLARLLDLWEATPAREANTSQMCQAVEHVRAYLAHPPSRQAEVGWGRDDLEPPAWIYHSVLAHACLLGVHSHRIWLPALAGY